MWAGEERRQQPRVSKLAQGPDGSSVNNSNNTNPKEMHALPSRRLPSSCVLWSCLSSLSVSQPCAFPLEHYSSLVSWLGHNDSVSFSSMWVIEHNKNIKKTSFKGEKSPLPLLYNNIGALSFQIQTIAASFRFGIHRWQMAMLKINRTFELFIL